MVENKKIIIAIDGFSSCGKSTMAKELAKRLGYIYVDSGAMYRAITLYCLEHGLITGEEVDQVALEKALPTISITFKLNRNGLPETYLDGKNVEREIRTMAVSDKVSQVSAIPFVRKALVSLQQALGKEKGIVMDGRDIGTTVFPDAELKIFVTASPEVRALRRCEELASKGAEVSFQTVLENVKKRDYIDQHREESPLVMAKDAVLLDNSTLSIEQQNEWLYNKYREVVSK
mgnify:CR=1 FL=1